MGLSAVNIIVRQSITETARACPASRHHGKAMRRWVNHSKGLAAPVKRKRTHRPSPDKRDSRKRAHHQNSNLAHYPRLRVPREVPGGTQAREARAPRASES